MSKTIKRCTVRFIENGVHGPSAVLMYRGRSLNSINYSRHDKLTPAKKKRARRMLMAGCDELRGSQ